MGEPITIKKKKKLSIKSKSANAKPKGDSDLGLAIPGLSAPPVVINVKSPSYTVYAILAIITTLMFIGILVIQYFEFDFLYPAFPHPIPPGM